MTGHHRGVTPRSDRRCVGRNGSGACNRIFQSACWPDSLCQYGNPEIVFGPVAWSSTDRQNGTGPYASRRRRPPMRRRVTCEAQQGDGTNRTRTQPLGLATSCFSGASPRRHRMSRRSRFPTEHRSGAGSLYREKHGFRAAVRARMVGVREKLGQLRRPRGRPLTPRLQAFSGRRDRSRLWA